MKHHDTVSENLYFKSTLGANQGSTSREQKALGIVWDTQEDHLVFDLR